MLLKSFIAGMVLSFLALGGNAQEPSLFVVLQDKKWGFIDKQGKIAIPAQFEYEFPFAEGLAKVTAGRGQSQSIGFIDLHGAPVVPPKYYEAGNFSEGLAPVAFRTDKTKPCVDCSTFDWNMQWGFIDKTGRTAIEARFRNAREFHEGLAAVQNDSGKWGFIDSSGAMAIPFSFDYATYFSEGLASVMKDASWGYIDTKGRWAVQPRFTSARDFHDGNAIAKTGGKFDRRECGLPCPPPSGGNWGVLDRKTLTIKGVRATIIFHDFSEGLLSWYADPNHCGYLDAQGTAVIPPQWSACADFSEGLARVETSGQTYYIDSGGKKIISSPAREAGNFHNGLAQVGEWWPDGSWQGYIDHTGKLVWSSGPLPVKKRIRE